MIDKDGSFAYSKIAWALAEGNESLKVYPNPASKQINIESTTDLTALKLINFSGIEVLSKKLDKVKSKSLQLPTLPADIYLLEAKNTNGISTYSRIIIE